MRTSASNSRTVLRLAVALAALAAVVALASSALPRNFSRRPSLAAALTAAGEVDKRAASIAAAVRIVDPLPATAFLPPPPAPPAPPPEPEKPAVAVVDTDPPEPAKEAVIAEAPRPVPPPPLPDASKLVLQGIMIRGGRPVAMIDNSIVSLGGTVGEFRVAGIARDHVMVTDRDGRSHEVRQLIGGERRHETQP